MMKFIQRLFLKKHFKPNPIPVSPEPTPLPEPPGIEFNPDIHLISPETLKIYLQEKRDLQIIDVREPYEWKTGRLNQAKHIPMNFLPVDMEKLDKEIETVMICEHGMRSLDTTFYLLTHGFKDVKSLDGGMANWYFKNENEFIVKG